MFLCWAVYTNRVLSHLWENCKSLSKRSGKINVRWFFYSLSAFSEGIHLKRDIDWSDHMLPIFWKFHPHLDGFHYYFYSVSVSRTFTSFNTHFTSLQACNSEFWLQVFQVFSCSFFLPLLLEHTMWINEAKKQENEQLDNKEKLWHNMFLQFSCFCSELRPHY